VGIPTLWNLPRRPQWIKSTLSYSNGACVEVASLPGGHIGVRNSRDSSGPVLKFTPDEWHAFIGGVRNGEFDRFAARAKQASGTVG
jgi:hypothetical protein